ncbi:MAG: hypothetical protein GPJ13_07940 [Microcystis aeruginosa W11-06]|nr:hypothetical protein [Microcystis aeruginosa W11-03]NCR93696.1 hypothetical protein [Microcystis aeruginosa W11-06]
MFSLNDLYELIAKISNLKGILALILGFALLSILLWWRAKKLNLGPQNQILDSRWSYTSHEVQEFFKNLEPKGVELYKWTEITVDGIFPFIYGAFCATFIVLLYPTEVARILILFPAFTTLTDLGENLTIFALASQYSKSKNSHLSNLTKIAMFFTRTKFVLLSTSLVIILIGGITKYHSFFFPLRVPIVFGLILGVFPILANTLASVLFQNLFFMRGSWQLASVTVGSTMAALMVSFTSEEIFLKNPSLISSSSQNLLPLMRYGLALLLTLPTWVMVWWRSRSELKPGEWISGILVGLVASGGFIGLIVWLGSLLKDFSVKNLAIFQQIPALGQYISQLREEDFLGLALGISGLLIYGLVIYFFKPRRKKIVSYLGEAPALLYALLLIWILTGVLGLLTSHLDPFHFPIILTLIVFSGLMYLFFEVDHYFKVTKICRPSSQDQDTPQEMKNFNKAIEKRLEKQKQYLEKQNQNLEEQLQKGELSQEKYENEIKKEQYNGLTLVVVAASGGGIQAAGWTVQVLNGLQEELGPSFTQAIGLISSVSGGSVGTMFFFDRFGKKGFPEQQELEIVFNNATEDNLDAVGWGLAYPDLVRIWFPPLAGGKYNDRGYAIEEDWKGNMRKPDATLKDLRTQIFNGQIPIPVFNATLVEDGRRFLISPMTFLENIQDAEKRKAFDFNTLFNGQNLNKKSQTNDEIYDLDITTAARLSASFPYVSPIARNDGDFKFNYHVADGGYFDNSGMFTAVEWLDKYLDDFSKKLNIKRVLLLQINASPEATLPPKIKGDKGWFMEWIGPLQAVYSVRDSTQASRNSKEVDLLEKEGIDIKSFTISFPERNLTTKKEYKQPLSWKLTEQQKENLRSGWEDVKQGQTFQKLRDLWQGQGQDQWNIPRNW